MNLTVTTHLHENRRFHVGFLPDAEKINAIILQAYQQLRPADFTKRSHHFNGRYENLYLPREKIFGMNLILQQATEFASQIIGDDRPSIRSGFWINDMGPLATTTEHDHDEDDELLSGVYYVKVPQNSGNLVIIDQYSRTEVQPQEGMFVFFAPDVLHAVTTNLSQSHRISIGMNFGPV